MEIKTSDLKSIINTVKLGLSDKQLVPGMTRFIFTGNDIVTYNGEMCIHYPLTTSFKCSVDATKFSKTVNQINAESLDLSFAEDVLNLKAGRISVKFSIDMQTTIIEEVIAKINEEVNADNEWKEIPTEFTSALSLVSFAASKDKSKQTQCCIHAIDNYLLAADLYMGKVSLYEFKDVFTPFMVNAKTIASLASMEISMMTVTKSWIHFANEYNVIFSLRKIEGNFPYDKIFELINNVEAVNIVLPDELKSAVNMTSIFANEDEPYIDMVITENSITCKSQTDEGSIEYPLDSPYKGELISFSVDTRLISLILGKTEIGRAHV